MINRRIESDLDVLELMLLMLKWKPCYITGLPNTTVHTNIVEHKLEILHKRKFMNSSYGCIKPKRDARRTKMFLLLITCYIDQIVIRPF